MNDALKKGWAYRHVGCQAGRYESSVKVPSTFSSPALSFHSSLQSTVYHCLDFLNRWPNCIYFFASSYCEPERVYRGPNCGSSASERLAPEVQPVPPLTPSEFFTHLTLYRTRSVFRALPIYLTSHIATLPAEVLRVKKIWN